MNRNGVSALRIILVLAAVLVAFVLVTMGQLYAAIGIAVVALGFGAAALFSRAKTPTD